MGAVQAAGGHCLMAAGVISSRWALIDGSWCDGRLQGLVAASFMAACKAWWQLASIHEWPALATACAYLAARLGCAAKVLLPLSGARCCISLVICRSGGSGTSTPEKELASGRCSATPISRCSHAHPLAAHRSGGSGASGSRRARARRRLRRRRRRCAQDCVVGCCTACRC